MRKVDELIKRFKKETVNYFNERVCKSQEYRLKEDDVHIVISSYVLGNLKVLITKSVQDGMYYEITYNANKDEIYLDVYKKWENKCIKF